MGGIKIINGGALTTLQDQGRWGAQETGFGTAGVMDNTSFRIANCLLGNKENEAVLEATLLGPEIEFDEDNFFVLTGADMDVKLDGLSIPRYQAIAASKGSVLKMGFAREGVRGYIAFAGGLKISGVMGSKSTSLKYRLGGLEGRKLMPGDSLEFSRPVTTLRHIKRRRVEPPLFQKKEWEIRVVPGPQEDYFTQEGIDTFFSSPYKVLPESDRMGYRLDGSPIAYKETVDIISDATVPGAIQVPSGGKPIILMADRQTTGGYAKIGTVISVDLPLLAQVAPGGQIRFKQVTVEQAQEALFHERKVLKEMERRMNGWL